VKQLVFWIVTTAVLLNYATVGLSILRPDLRVWPPPGRRSWQYVYNGVVSYTGLFGVVALGLADRNSLAFDHWTRFVLGGLLTVCGLFALWAFLTLGAEASQGLGRDLVTSAVRRHDRGGAGLCDPVQLEAGTRGGAARRRVVPARALRGGAVVSGAARRGIRGVRGEGPPVPGPAAMSYDDANTMCRNIKTLHNFKPPATDQEIRASALQFVRKLSGFTRPSKANEVAFARAVERVTGAAHELLDALVTSAPPRDRDVEAAKARGRAAVRFRSAVTTTG
jgi:hypothetical protein